MKAFGMVEAYMLALWFSVACMQVLLVLEVYMLVLQVQVVYMLAWQVLEDCMFAWVVGYRQA